MSEQQSNKLVEAYHTMLERAREAMARLGHEAKPKLEQALEEARETAWKLGELSEEEAEKISDYILRDLRDAAEYIAEGERGLADWLRLDLLYLEDKAMETFSHMVDQTRLELDRLALNAALYGEWHTGEITAPGTLECKQCGELLHFHKTAHIPPCPKCHGTRFRRRLENEAG